jgi:aarF domain-containing kinase
MATRPDLFSAQLCTIFNELHSNAPIHSADRTRQLLHENNIRLETSTSDFLSTPLASGAIAQVYRCQIDGRDLIMKVRHPGVQDEIYGDLKIFNCVARLLMKFVSKKTFQWLNIDENIRSFTINMLLQTNLTIEAANLHIFERNFQQDQSKIRFPHVDRLLPASNDILFQTYEHGQLLNDFLATCTDKRLRKKLAYLGVNAYLKMLFVDNFVRSS